jgi:hypothetical protein
MKNSEQLVPVFRVFPPHVTARLAVEQASTFGWDDTSESGDA